MPTLFVLTGLVCACSQVQAYKHSDVAGMRFAHFELLCQEYQTEVRSIGSQDPANVVRENEKARLDREFYPNFLALAAENPADETALRCCMWVVAHCGTQGRDHKMFEADNTAWRLIERYQGPSDLNLMSLCREAARSPTPAREEFLRSLPNNYRLPVEVHGAAFLGLADLLANRHEIASRADRFGKQRIPELAAYFAAGGATQLKAESVELYQHVLKHYADVPLTSTGTESSKFATLGERAAQRLANLGFNDSARKAPRTIPPKHLSRR